MFDMNITQRPTYDPIAVQPFRDELTWVGFHELLTPRDVDTALGTKGTTLVVLNSVCGCAAGSARPGIALALQHAKIPDQLTTVFAGMEKDAVDHLRSNYLSAFPPSSPLIALFQDGKPVFAMQRMHIEGNSAERIASLLVQAFDAYCTMQGPSVSKEKYDQLVHAKMCGSKIPRLDQ